MSYNIGINLFEEYKKWLSISNEYAPNTLKNYCQVISRLLKNNKYLDFKIFRDFVSTGKNKRMKIASVNNFKEFLLDKKEIEFKAYRVPKIKKIKRVVTVLSPEDVGKIIEKMEGKYKLITELLYKSAMRISEIFNIKTSDFNWDKWEKDPKDLLELKISKSKRDRERIVFISSSTAKKIASYINNYKQDAACNILFDLGIISYSKYKTRTIKRLKLPTKKPIDKEVSLEIINNRYNRKNCEYFGVLVKRIGNEALKRNDINYIELLEFFI